MLKFKLKEMFNEVVVKKNVSLIKDYYHPQFLLYTNGQIINYADFLESHEQYYATKRQYEIAYDEETFLEQDTKIAGRIWISISEPGYTLKEIEVMLIAEYKVGKIYRLWELTYPDWSNLPEFNNEVVKE